MNGDDAGTEKPPMTPERKKQAEMLLAAVLVLEAVEFYADPQTYFALAVLADRPAGEFADDHGPLRKEDVWEDYRGDGGAYYGHKARTAVMALRKAFED